jgi:hypothetical protein
MTGTVTVLSEWLKTHPHSRVDFVGDNVVLTFGPQSENLPFPAWMWLNPWLWPILLMCCFEEE